MRNLPGTAREELYEHAQQLSKVFSTQPTSGDDKRFWFNREELERELAFQLGTVDQHICIDGPSGSGKTSLAQKIFRTHNRDFIHIQVTKDMAWQDFTRQFIDVPRASKTNSTVEGKGVLSFFRSSIGGSIKYGEENSEKDSYELLRAKSIDWKSTDIAKWIGDNGIVLIVDDLESASEEILHNLSSVPKLLGQTFQGKIVFIGVDDIYTRLARNNPSLKHRLSEISVGGLANKGESANFVLDKFDVLGIKTPLTNPKCNKETKGKVRDYIYDAANGLMKELNLLGLTLARQLGGNRKAISVADVRNECLRLSQETRRKNRHAIQSLSQVIGENSDFRHTFRYLMSKSSSSITLVAELEEQLHGVASEDQIRSALEYMSDNNLVTITGGPEPRIFFLDPSLLNCLRAHLRNPKELGWDPRGDSTISQYSLGLIGGSSADPS